MFRFYFFFCRRRFLTRFLFFFLFFLSNLSSTNVEVIIFITSLAVSWFFSVRVRVRVCRSTKGCMTVKGWLRCSVFYFFFYFESCFPSTSVTPEMLLFFLLVVAVVGGGTLSSASPPSAFLFLFLMYHRFFIFLFTKRIMLFVLSTVKQSLLRHWKAISLYETFTMYLLWLTFDSSSLLFTCTLGVIIEVNLFYTNTKRVRWRFLFFTLFYSRVCLVVSGGGKVFSEKETSWSRESAKILSLYNDICSLVLPCSNRLQVSFHVHRLVFLYVCVRDWCSMNAPLTPSPPTPTATRRPLRISAGRVLVGGADQRRAEGAHPEAGARPEHHPGHVLPAAARRRRLRAQRLEQHPGAHQGGHRHVHQYVFNTHLRFLIFFSTDLVFKSVIKITFFFSPTRQMNCFQ